MIKLIGVFNLESAYSLLGNTIPINKLVELAKKNSYDFIALADTKLYGLYSLFSLCKNEDIKPIIGLRLKVEEDSFYVFVKNNEGYHNLLKLSLLEDSNELKYNDLKNYEKGLIFITSGKHSKISDLILDDKFDNAEALILQYKKDFNNFYLGLNLDSFDLEMKVAPKLKEIGIKHSIELLPLHTTKYEAKEDRLVYETILQIGGKENETLDYNYHFYAREELKKLFYDYPNVFENNKKVIDSITFDFNLPNFKMPAYKVDNGTTKEYLDSLSKVGLKKRLKNKPNVNEVEYQQRLLYELNVINTMGFDNYFLIVYDFVRFAKTNNIMVGPGRGSAAGSLVAYCLGITDVDPIEYGLLFERFLNPDRISMPDIDLDFPDNKRDLVINYLFDKYSSNNVATIITFGTFAFRSSIRDVAKVLEIENVDRIIRQVESNKYTSDITTQNLIDTASKIEGLPRHTGTHAAGIILSHEDLTKWIPLQNGLYNNYQTQLEASDLEKLGLLKIDLLGIRNLSVIEEVLEKVDENIDLNNIELTDKKTYELLQNAETSGIFQLESSGMRNVLRKLKPETFEDIVAVLALFRPGPMQFIDEYIRRKNGGKFEYDDKSLEPILKSTYGIIIYQEQIMQIAHQFAGYTLAEADLLRRGISKKDHIYMEEERERFVNKCLENGHSVDLSHHIYDLILRFSDYGFNRSHSVSYAVIAHQMAYLKANHFGIFMTILMSSVTNNEALTKAYLQEVRSKGIEIIPPNINLSTNEYQYVGNKILLPLTIVKGIGKTTYEKIVNIRNEKAFSDFFDFKNRTQGAVNERNIEYLIYASAFSDFDLNKRTLIENKDLKYAGYEAYISDFVLKEEEEYSFIKLTDFEKEALGFNVVYNPLSPYQEYIEKHNLNNFSYLKNNKEGNIVGYIRNVKVIETKAGQKMAFIEVDDGETTKDITIFANTYSLVANHLTDEVQIFKIRVGEYRGRKSYSLVSLNQIKR